MFKVTYTGEGVMSNKLGAFQNGTTAFTADEQLARELATQTAWSVAAPDGSAVGAPRAETREEPVHAAVDTESFGGRRHERKKSVKTED